MKKLYCKIFDYYNADKTVNARLVFSIELDKTILKWDLEISKIEKNINNSHFDENYSFLKIERKTLEFLINLNNRLKFGTISKLLESLTRNYEDMFSKDTLLEIKSICLIHIIF
jgi:predicted P-loop ATPase